MYILTTKATLTDPKEEELIESPGEGVAAFIEAMYDIQEPVEVLFVLDDYTGEEIELHLSDYFSPDIRELPWGECEVTTEEMGDCAK